MTWVRWWRCLHSGAYGTCGTALTAVTQRPLNVNALVQTDGHAHVTGRTSGRGYASREYFDWPQVRRIPPHLWWLGFRTWWTQNELQSDANYTQSTDRERTASVPTAWIEVSCVCVCVCVCVSSLLLNNATITTCIYRRSRVHICSKKAGIQLKIPGARRKFQ